MMVVGVDGRRSRWVAAVLVDGQFAGGSAFDTFDALLAAVPDAMAVATNVPLGLVPHGVRRCDGIVRSFVGPAADAVLQVPPRAAVEELDPERASELCAQLTGMLPQLPCPTLRARILELDALIHSCGDGGRLPRRRGLSSIPPPGARPEPRPGRRNSWAGRQVDFRTDTRNLARAIRRDSTPHLRPSGVRRALPVGRIVEANAEASYRLLHGRPLDAARSSREGMLLRAELLMSAGIEIPADLGRAGGVGADEVLDAAALAWTAKRYSNGHARSLPPQEQWQLDGGRVVAIWI